MADAYILKNSSSISSLVDYSYRETTHPLPKLDTPIMSSRAGTSPFSISLSCPNKLMAYQNLHFLYRWKEEASQNPKEGTQKHEAE